MAKYKPQHARLLFIDREINTGRFPNCRKLAQEYEVSGKTIQRDLDYMRYQLDAPLEYSAKHRGYYYTEKNYKLPAIDIKESDLLPCTLPTSCLSSTKEQRSTIACAQSLKRLRTLCQTKSPLILEMSFHVLRYSHPPTRSSDLVYGRRLPVPFGCPGNLRWTTRHQEANPQNGLPLAQSVQAE